jgi:hypothetical protein
MPLERSLSLKPAGSSRDWTVRHTILLTAGPVCSPLKTEISGKL